MSQSNFLPRSVAVRCWLYVVLLAVIAPISGEILNRSTSLLELVSLKLAMVWLLPYSLLIIALVFLAERALRKSNILFLLPVAGLVIEGLLVGSFFNVSFADLSVLSGVGVAWGVQWPWTFSLLASHAMVSFLIPYTLAESFRCEGVRMISARVAMFATLVLGAIIAIVVAKSGAYYFIDRIATLMTIIAFVGAVFWIRLPESHHESMPGWIFFVLGFLFVPLNWLTSFFLSHKSLILILAAQAIFIVGYLFFLWGQWFSVKTPRSKRMLFIAGYLVPAAIGPALLGKRVFLNDVVGIATLVIIVSILLVSVRLSAVDTRKNEAQ